MKRNTASTIRTFKGAEEPMVCLTSYTAPMARLADEHADLILVGDSLGMVLYNFESTVPVTMEMMIRHGQAVVSSTKNAFIVVDMPFGSYQRDPGQAFENAATIMKQTGCGAVKLEGGVEMAETVSFISQRGIPVLGHIGLQPQSVNSYGGYKAKGKTTAEETYIKDSAKALSKAGALAIVLECMDEMLSNEITGLIDAPTIGIGASAGCDGQILVSEDLLALTAGPHARFVKHYAGIGEAVGNAFKEYAADVRSRSFPAEEHVYRLKAGHLKTVEQGS